MIDICFIKAVIVWLSDFPGCPIEPTDSYFRLADPAIFSQILSAIIGEDISTNFISNTIATHLQSKATTKRVTTMQHLLSNLNFDDLFLEKNLNCITTACELLYHIGTHTSKFASLGITSLGFLRDYDKDAIDSYLERLDPNLILIQELESLRILLEDEAPLFQCIELVKHLKVSMQQATPKTQDSNVSSYIEETYIESLLWENSLLEDLVYQIIS